MRRRTLLRTGATAAAAGLAGCPDPPSLGPSPTVRWRTDLQLSRRPVADVVRDSGALYVETDDGVVALDPDDGERTWTLERRSIEGVHGGMVFVEGPNDAGEGGRTVAAVPAAGFVSWTAPGRFLHAERPSVYLLGDRAAADGSAPFPLLRALDPRDGHEQWSYRFEHSPAPFIRVYGPDVVYVASVESGEPPTTWVTCINPASAAVLWRERVGPGTLPATVWRRGRLFVGTERPNERVEATVTALDGDGSTRWQRGWDRPFAFPRWTSGGRVVVQLARDVHAGEDWSTVLISEMFDGERWRARGQFVNVREDEGLVVLFRGDALVAVGLDDGEVRHRVDVGDELAASDASPDERVKRRPSVTSAGETVYVTAGTTLLALDVEAGVRWSFEADRPLGVLGVVDDVVYAGTSETLNALEDP